MGVKNSSKNHRSVNPGLVHRVLYTLANKLYIFTIARPHLRAVFIKINLHLRLFNNTNDVINYARDQAALARRKNITGEAAISCQSEKGESFFIYHIQSSEEASVAYKHYLKFGFPKKTGVLLVDNRDSSFLRQCLEKYQSKQLFVIAQAYCNEYENLLPTQSVYFSFTQECHIIRQKRGDHE